MAPIDLPAIDAGIGWRCSSSGTANYLRHPPVEVIHSEELVLLEDRLPSRSLLDTSK